MKNQIKRMVALAVAACASSSFAGFTVTVSSPVTSGGFTRYDITAVNTGGDTGTQIKGLEYFYSGQPVFFEVGDVSDPGGGDPDGVPDTVNLLSTSRTRVRVSSTGANNVFVGVSPTNEFAQPNPYNNGVTAFQGAIANTGTTQASGAGFQIARLFVASGVVIGGTFSGNIGGDIGSKVPFSVQLPHGDPVPPVIPAVPVVNVVFGSIVTNGAPFSVDVTVTDADAADIVSLAAGALPAPVSNVAITGTPGVSPRTFTLSGIVDYSANGTDVVIPLIASDNNGFTATGSVTLHVTPEPALLGSLSLVLMGARRRRS